MSTTRTKKDLPKSASIKSKDMKEEHTAKLMISDSESLKKATEGAEEITEFSGLKKLNIDIEFDSFTESSKSYGEFYKSNNKQCSDFILILTSNLLKLFNLESLSFQIIVRGSYKVFTIDNNINEFFHQIINFINKAEALKKLKLPFDVKEMPDLSLFDKFVAIPKVKEFLCPSASVSSASPNFDIPLFNSKFKLFSFVDEGAAKRKVDLSLYKKEWDSSRIRKEACSDPNTLNRILDILMKYPVITSLSFKECDLTDDGLDFLIQKILFNDAIQIGYLDISDNNITDRGLTKLELALGKKKGLYALCLNNNPLTNASTSVLLKIARGNYNISAILFGNEYESRFQQVFPDVTSLKTLGEELKKIETTNKKLSENKSPTDSIVTRLWYRYDHKKLQLSQEAIKDRKKTVKQIESFNTWLQQNQDSLHAEVIAGKLDRIQMLLPLPSTTTTKKPRVCFHYFHAITHDTYLHLAAREGHYHIVEHLLKLGHNATLENKEHKTALQLARESKTIHDTENLQKTIQLLESWVPAQEMLIEPVPDSTKQSKKRKLSSSPSGAKEPSKEIKLQSHLQLSTSSSSGPMLPLVPQDGSLLINQDEIARIFHAIESTIAKRNYSQLRQLLREVETLGFHLPILKLQDSNGRTLLHICVYHANLDAFDRLLAEPEIDFSLKDQKGHTINDALEMELASAASSSEVHSQLKLMQFISNRRMKRDKPLEMGNINWSKDLWVMFGGRPSKDKAVSVPSAAIHRDLKQQLDHYASTRYLKKIDTKARGKDQQNPTDIKMTTEDNLVAAAITFVISDKRHQKDGDHKRIALTLSLASRQTHVSHFQVKEDEGGIELESSRNRTFLQNILNRLRDAPAAASQRCVDDYSTLQPLSKEAIEQIFKEADSRFYERFHHSEQALLEYLEQPETVGGIISLLEQQPQFKFQCKIYAVILDIYSSPRYVCGNCEMGIFGLQNKDSVFITLMRDGLSKLGCILPSGSLRMITRVSADRPSGSKKEEQIQHSPLFVDLRAIRKNDLILERDITIEPLDSIFLSRVR